MHGGRFRQKAADQPPQTHQIAFHVTPKRLPEDRLSIFLPHAGDPLLLESFPFVPKLLHGHDGGIRQLHPCAGQLAAGSPFNAAKNLKRTYVAAKKTLPRVPQRDPGMG